MTIHVVQDKFRPRQRTDGAHSQLSLFLPGLQSGGRGDTQNELAVFLPSLVGAFKVV